MFALESEVLQNGTLGFWPHPFLPYCIHPFDKTPLLVDLKRPESKIAHTVNFYLRPEPGVLLGICSFGMQVLSDGGFHVLSVDYRGFGDSTGTPTEEGLTRDAICVYEWTKARSGRTPVCLWGHSLGTGVATNAARALEAKGCPVDAIVLEAPFTNMWVASINYPLLKIYKKLPRCLRMLMDALKEDKIVFPSDENVKFLSSPLLILHGEDDRTVPLECGKQLYEIARNAYRNKDRVKMVVFPPGFHHNLLCKSPLLLRSVSCAATVTRAVLSYSDQVCELTQAFFLQRLPEPAVGMRAWRSRNRQ
ncbi:abhydrolase domain containing 12B [Cricetulus griseus]